MPRSTPSEIAEHRKSARHAFNGEILIRWSGRTIYARGRDLSATGISFYIDSHEFGRGPVLQRLALGRFIRLSFGSASAGEEVANNVLGRIVRILPSEKTDLVAVALAQTETEPV